MKASEPKIPKSAITAQQQKLRKTAFPATRLACFPSPRPNARDTRALTPTPVPVPRPIIIFCAGNARESAERQSSETRATKILSTTLYRACTSMESIMGTAILSRSFPSFISPIRLESIFLIFAISNHRTLQVLFFYLLWSPIIAYLRECDKALPLPFPGSSVDGKPASRYNSFIPLRR